MDELERYQIYNDAINDVLDWMEREMSMLLAEKNSVGWWKGGKTITYRELLDAFIKGWVKDMEIVSGMKKYHYNTTLKNNNSDVTPENST